MPRGSSVAASWHDRWRGRGRAGRKREGEGAHTRLGAAAAPAPFCPRCGLPAAHLLALPACLLPAGRIHETEKGYYADGEVRPPAAPPPPPLSRSACQGYRLAGGLGGAPPLGVVFGASTAPAWQRPRPCQFPRALQDAYSMRLTFPEGEKAAAEKAAAAAKQQQQGGSSDKPAATGAARKAGKRR